MFNLDAMNNQELLDLYLEIENHPHITAKKLQMTVKDVKNIKHYAINKRVAIICRLEGKIEEALKYENICEKIYNELSNDAKW
jgi:hypothetical protein